MLGSYVYIHHLSQFEGGPQPLDRYPKKPYFIDSLILLVPMLNETETVEYSLVQSKLIKYPLMWPCVLCPLQPVFLAVSTIPLKQNLSNTLVFVWELVRKLFLQI